MTTAINPVRVGEKSFPVISIILPTHPQYPKFKNDRERMIALMKEAETQLSEMYSKQKTELLMNRLHRLVNEINFAHLSAGLAIYLTDTTEKVIQLPFPVSEKVIVGDSYEVRDLVYSAKKNKNYLLAIINLNIVKTFLGYGSELTPVSFPEMPTDVKDVINEHSFPGKKYLDVQAYDEKNIHNFIHLIDEVLEKEINLLAFPLILMADTKLLGYFRSQSRNTKQIIGYVEGNYDHHSLNNIAEKIQPVLSAYISKEADEALFQLAGAVSNDCFAAGISQVWRDASEGRGRLLIVEKDYRQPARYGDDEYTILIEDTSLPGLNVIADAVDDIIETVLKNKGDVVFVENGRLKDFQRIALITRY